MDVTIRPEQTLAYDRGGPSSDGGSWWPPFNGEISELLNGHRYQKALVIHPADGGIVFEVHSGCLVYWLAYWDGTYLWIKSRGGWLPYTPSDGFGDELERLLNEHPEIIQLDWSDFYG